MRLPTFKKKFVAIAAAAGLAVGSGGLAFAFIAAPTASTTGSGSVHTAQAVDITATTVVFTATTTPTFANFSITNPNGSRVHLGMARVSTVRTETCTLTGNHHSPLVTNTTGSHAVGTVTPGMTSVTNTSNRNPTFTLHNTPTYNQSDCTITYKLSV